MNNGNYDQLIEKEIEKAIHARKNGNEGQARVCARRAAGLAVRKYFEKKEIPIYHKSAYELLISIIQQPNIPSIARENAIHLTLRVSESFKLPDEIDLIDDARSLCNILNSA